MLRLLDELYELDYAGDLTSYLMQDEREEFQMALHNQRTLRAELENRLPEPDRTRLERLLENRDEADAERERLSFRRGLVMGLKLGALAGR